MRRQSLLIQAAKLNGSGWNEQIARDSGVRVPTLVGQLIQIKSPNEVGTLIFEVNTLAITLQISEYGRLIFHPIDLVCLRTKAIDFQVLNFQVLRRTIHLRGSTIYGTSITAGECTDFFRASI